MPCTPIVKTAYITTSEINELFVYFQMTKLLCLLINLFRLVLSKETTEPFASFLFHSFYNRLFKNCFKNTTNLVNLLSYIHIVLQIENSF